jgi:hypothetical protein
LHGERTEATWANRRGGLINIISRHAMNRNVG